jgi:hypothetical protein
MTTNKNTSQNESSRNGSPKVFGVLWWRAMHGEFNDERLAVVARRAGVQQIVAVGMLAVLFEYASSRLDDERGSIEGIDIESIALRAGLEEETVRKLLSAFEEKGYFKDDRFVGWSKTQVLREDPTSTERSRRFRERQSADEEASRHGDAPATHGDAPGTHLQRGATPEKNRADQTRADRADQTREEHTRAEKIRPDQIRTDQTRSEQKRSEQGIADSEKDSGLAGVQEDSDSPGGKDIRSQGDDNIVSPSDSYDGLLAEEWIPSVTDSNSPALAGNREALILTPMNDNRPPDLTEETLEQVVSKVFGRSSVDAARALAKLGGLTALKAAIHEAMAAPEPARKRALQYALEDQRAAAGFEVHQFSRQPITEVTERDFLGWAQLKLVVVGDTLPNRILNATASIEAAMKIVDGARARPESERGNYLLREMRRAKFMRDSEPGSNDDWPRDYGDQFWAAYPRQIGKEATMQELKKLRAQGMSFTDIIMGAEDYGFDTEKTDPQYVKSPANWLKKRCWSDESARACA